MEKFRGHFCKKIGQKPTFGQFWSVFRPKNGQKLCKKWLFLTQKWAFGQKSGHFAHFFFKSGQRKTQYLCGFWDFLVKNPLFLL